MYDKGSKQLLTKLMLHVKTQKLCAAAYCGDDDHLPLLKFVWMGDNTPVQFGCFLYLFPPIPCSHPAPTHLSLEFLHGADLDAVPSLARQQLTDALDLASVRRDHANLTILGPESAGSLYGEGIYR